MDEELQARIRRIYAAIGGTEEVDISRFQPKVGVSDKFVFVVQDFRGGLDEAQISNLAHSAIHNVASLPDHLRSWAARNNRDPREVDGAVKASFHLRVIIDLWNAEKHPYPPRDGGRSGKAPRLAEVTRAARLSTGPQPGSSAGLRLAPRLTHQLSGTGSVKVVVTGTIVDKDGCVLGDLHDFLGKAVADWECLLARFGVNA